MLHNLFTGVAYVLKLVDQYHAFDSLHWFQSVRMKYDDDMVSSCLLSYSLGSHKSSVFHSIYSEKGACIR